MRNTDSIWYLNMDEKEKAIVGTSSYKRVLFTGNWEHSSENIFKNAALKQPEEDV